MQKILLSLLAAAVLVSCSALRGTSAGSAAGTTTTAPALSAATTSGQAVGNALRALYTQYKTDGKYDYKNVNNAINATLLLANISDLPKNMKNASYLKDFSQGLMGTSAGLVNQNNVTTVTDNLTTIAKEYATNVVDKAAEKTTEKTAEVADKAASTTSTIADKLATAASTATSISSLLSLFGNK